MKKDAKDKPRHPWRDNVEALTMAIMMAVLLKYFVIEAYKIPTGSMQPTLMGNRETGIFDRILVDKLSFHLRDPKRFEVVVFKYPLDRSKNFIKRIVGMPGEQLRILSGDLWTRPDESSEWTVLRRPRKVLDDVLKPLIPEKGDPVWRVEGSSSWEAGTQRIVAVGDGTARFPRHSGSVMDNYADGYPPKMASKLVRKPGSGQYPVGDLRIECQVKAEPGCEQVTLELREGDRSYRFELPGPAAPEQSLPAIAIEGLAPGDGGTDARASAEKPFRLKAGKSVPVVVQNIDDLLTFRIRGKTVVEVEIPRADDQRRARALVSVTGEGATFDPIQVSRDIYYTSAGKRDDWTIPDDSYVVLGDNTQDSSDSREWSFALYDLDPEQRERIYGTSEAGPDTIRANYRGMNENPMVVNGGPEGPRVWLRDEWGEWMSFPQSGATRPNPATELSSYVPRHLITGRAVVVFWPFSPKLGVFRMKWIR